MDFLLGTLLIMALLLAPVFMGMIAYLLWGIRSDLRIVVQILAQRRKREETDREIRML